MEQHHLCNIGRGYYEEQFCKIILYLDQWFRRKSGALVALLFISWTICAILVEGIKRINSVKLFWIWTSSTDVILKISYLELWQPSCSVEQNHLCNFERGHHGEHSCDVIWNLNQRFRRCPLKIFLNLSSGSPFVQLSGTICNFGRAYYEEQFCEIILNLDHWFRRCLLKIFLVWSFGSPFVQRSRTICANLVEGIKRNNSVK